jgi:hypothetical protein
MTIETLDYSPKVVEYSDHPQRPYKLPFNKKPEAIPDECFIRVGKKNCHYSK